MTTRTPANDEIIRRAREAVMQQAADLMVKANLSPEQVIELYTGAAVSIFMRLAPASQIASYFRKLANELEASGATH